MQWAGGHLHQKLAIDSALPQIGFPPHQIFLHHHPKSQNSSLETQNRLEATSHQKLVTDGASTKMVPTHTEWLTANHHELDQLIWAGVNLSSEHVVTGGWGSSRVSSFVRNSNRIRLELYATLLLYITQPLIQPLYGFLGSNLGWKRNWDNFILKHADSDIAILGEFRPKSAGKHLKSLN